MVNYRFYNATELINFLESNKSRYEGKVLKEVYTDFGNCYIPFRRQLTDNPVILQIDDLYVAVNCYVPSDLNIIAGKFDDVYDYSDERWVLDNSLDCDDEPVHEFMDRPPASDIKNHKIVSVDVKRFSDEFDIDYARGVCRPNGGDYFSTISITLDNGVKICICGADAMCDGYIELWAE